MKSSWTNHAQIASRAHYVTTKSNLSGARLVRWKNKENTTPVSNSDISSLTGTGTCSAADDDTSECTINRSHIFSVNETVKGLKEISNHSSKCGECVKQRVV